MPYTRSPTWPDEPARRDYIIRREDLQIGRVYLTNTPYGDRFVWSITIRTGRVDQRLGGDARQGRRRDAEGLCSDEREAPAAASSSSTDDLQRLPPDQSGPISTWRLHPQSDGCP